MTQTRSLGRPQTLLCIRHLTSGGLPAPGNSLFLAPGPFQPPPPASFSSWCSCVYLGLLGSGYFSVCGHFLVPHPADAWVELCVSGVAYLNHRLLFLEDYEGGGWEERTRDPESEWRRDLIW